MMSLVFQSNPDWTSTRVNGSDAHVRHGMGATKRTPMDCRVEWFSGKSTIILDGGTHRAPDHIGEVYATWELLVPKSIAATAEYGYLLIACVRDLGGLHGKEGKKANIFLNDHPRNQIGLGRNPSGYGDYEHRPSKDPSLPQLKDIDPILSSCATIYTFTVHSEHLNKVGRQIARIIVDPEVRWDIDYVALVLCRSRRALRPWVRQILLVMLGAIIGSIATMLLAHLL